MDLISFIAKWAAKNLNGPMAVLLIISNAWWIWFVLRLRKEGKATIKEFVDALELREKAVNDEKDARRKEALDLQSKGYESIGKLAQLMDRIEDLLKRLEGAMVNCMKHGQG